jgi:hypothetical protein
MALTGPIIGEILIIGEMDKAMRALEAKTQTK